MSESARKKQRVALRDSDEPASMNPGTPYTDLHQLAAVITKPTTPYRRASSLGATPASLRTPNVVIRTPGTAARTPRAGPSTRHISARRIAPTTPHAIRALRERANAARTPGRRRSGRVQRETPRDILRALSKTLAPYTRPVEPSPREPTPRHPALNLPDFDDDEPTRPRLSMAMDDMYEDDSFHDAPPRRSILADLPDDADADTMHSLEFGRRAYSEDPRSFGRRDSERFDEFNGLGMDEDEYEVDGIFVNRRTTMGPDQLLEAMTEEMDDTGEIRALTGRRNGRPSDVDLGVFGEMDEPDEPTFRFNIPQRIRAPVQDDQLETNQSVQDAEESADEGAEEDDGQGGQLNIVVSDDDEAPGDFGNIGWESDIEEDVELQAYREEASAIDRSLLDQSPERPGTEEKRPPRQRKTVNISRTGHEFPSFPAATVKRLASGLAKSQGGNAKISKDTLDMLVQTTDWFFEGVGEDLAAYAQHAGRNKIEESDVVALMKRQRLITKNTTAFSLAQKMLPRELLQELRMQPVGKLKRQKRKRMEAIQEEDEEEE